MSPLVLRALVSLLTPLLAIAVFFAAFGAGTLVAIAFTADSRGRVVNAVCGLLFWGVAAAFYAGHRRVLASRGGAAEPGDGDSPRPLREARGEADRCRER